MYLNTPRVLEPLKQIGEQNKLVGSFYLRDGPFISTAECSDLADDCRIVSQSPGGLTSVCSRERYLRLRDSGATDSRQGYKYCIKSLGQTDRNCQAALRALRHDELQKHTGMGS